MHKKVMETREKIIDVASMTIDDIIIRGDDGKPTQVAVNIEDVRDLRTVAELLLKVGGVPEKTESRVESKVTGDLSVKTEVVDPALAAEVGKAIAMKESQEVDDEV